MYSNLYEMSRIEKPIIRDIKEITTRARRFGRKWGVTSKSFCGEWWKLFEIRADGDTTLYKKNNWTVYFKWTNHMVYENCSVVSDSLQSHGLSMEFSRQEYWIGLPFPSPRYLPDPGIKPGSPALQADSLPSELQGIPWYMNCTSIQPLLKETNCTHVCVHTHTLIPSEVFRLKNQSYARLHLFFEDQHLVLWESGSKIP